MSVIHKFKPGKNNEMEWAGVEKESYSPNNVGSYMQRILSRKDNSNNIEFRYFVLNPTDRSNFEKHNYEHLVFIVSGEGSVLIQDEEHAISQGDTIFISSDEIHQLRAGNEVPLTFFCIVLDKELRFQVHGEQHLEIYDNNTEEIKERKDWKTYSEMIRN